MHCNEKTKIFKRASGGGDVAKSRLFDNAFLGQAEGPPAVKTGEIISDDGFVTLGVPEDLAMARQFLLSFIEIIDIVPDGTAEQTAAAA